MTTQPTHTPTPETKCHQTRYGNPNCLCVHCQKLDENKCADCKQLIIDELTTLLKACAGFAAMSKGFMFDGKPLSQAIREALAHVGGK